MPPWLEEMREERVVRYDTLRYPLAEAAAAVLELRPGETLDMLHLREVSAWSSVRIGARARGSRPRPWTRSICVRSRRRDPSPDPTEALA